jgi:hypothetical protein
MPKSGRKKQLRDSGGKAGVKSGQTSGQQKGQQAAGMKPGGQGDATQGTQRQP